MTALWLACHSANTQIVKLLLKMEGSHRDSLAPDGTTALAIALGHGHRDVVSTLYHCPLLQEEACALSAAYEILGCCSGPGNVSVKVDKSVITKQVSREGPALVKNRYDFS